MRVWIDQDLCVGAGLCAEVAPGLFALGDDGLAYVKPSVKDGHVPAGMEDDAIEAAEACPEECVFIEVD